MFSLHAMLAIDAAEEFVVYKFLEKTQLRGTDIELLAQHWVQKFLKRISLCVVSKVLRTRDWTRL
jgi:1-deoxy-D-xylulose 5-phosphate reductoisomerase